MIPTETAVYRKDGDLHSSMSAETQVAVTADPMIAILAAFYSIPTNCHSSLFSDFADAANSHDLRTLLDTISDWAATAEVYAHPRLAADLREAITSNPSADVLEGFAEDAARDVHGPVGIVQE